MEAIELEMHENTPFGQLLVEVNVVRADGTVIRMLAIHPCAMLYKLFKQCGGLVDHIVAVHLARPSSSEEPWHLVYMLRKKRKQKVVPGNVISHDNWRNVWLIYFSCMELGAIALQHEDARLPAMIKRSSNIATLAAGVSQAFAAVARLFRWPHF